MDSAKLGDWIQIIGIFAVVASLVFVGLQLKQSQEIAVAAQYHNRAALAIEINSSKLEYGNLKMWGFLTGRVGDGLIPTQLREEQASWSAEQWGAHPGAARPARKLLRIRMRKHRCKAMWR